MDAAPKSLKIAVFTETFLPKIDGIVSILCLMLQRLNELGHQVLLFGPPGGPAEYAGGHLQGACLMPLPQLAQDMATLCSDLSRPVVVYCAAGVRSASAVDQLRELGYQQVINGGSIGRLALASGLPVVRGPEGH